jgi:alkyldihydroxyacetonephosphate synthase
VPVLADCASISQMPERERRWNGWGFAGESLPVPAAARAWLGERLGEGDPLPTVRESEVVIPPSRPLPTLPAPTLTAPEARLRAACGHSLPDLLALRTGAIAAFPDAVCYPESAEQVVAVLTVAAAAGVAVIPRGGGTSVVGGVTVRPGARPTVVLSLERLRGLVRVDTTSRLAAFRAGSLGPEVEAALAPHGLRLGHEPQSFEFSTLGGWIATRAAGHFATLWTHIEDFVDR